MSEWSGFDAEIIGTWPPERTPVIVCGYNGHVQHIAYQLVLDHNGAHWEDMMGYGDDIDIFNGYKITHWMHLPEPPK
mgnify:CR=1 FL=1